MPNDSIDEITGRLNRALIMAQLSTSANSTGLLVLNEMQKRPIKAIIQDMMREGNDNLKDEVTDKPVGRTSANLEELNKVPDVANCGSSLVGQENLTLGENQ